MLFFGTFCCDCAPSCWGHHQMNCMYVQMGTRVRMSGITCFVPSCGSYGGDGSFFRPCFVYCDCVDCLSHSHSHLASCCFICYHLDNRVGTQLLNKIKQSKRRLTQIFQCYRARACRLYEKDFQTLVLDLCSLVLSLAFHLKLVFNLETVLIDSKLSCTDSPFFTTLRPAI